MPSVIKPITLGNLHLPHNLIQAPLAGVSSAPFRELPQAFLPPAYACTEMMSAKALCTQPLHLQGRFLYKSPQEGLLCYQLSGTNPTELAHACKIVEAHGADLIDLNCGCPKLKIRKKGCGSKLLETPDSLRMIIRAMRQATALPLSIKIRLPAENSLDYLPELLSIIHEEALDFIVVHARSWKDDYDKAVDLDRLATFKANCKIPVIANGDVKDSASVKHCLEKTGCDGVMIGRASVGQPWLFQQIVNELQGHEFHRPPNASIAQRLVQHAEGLATLLNAEKPAVLQMRKLSKYYSREQPWQKAFLSEVYQCENLEALRTVISRFFSD